MENSMRFGLMAVFAVSGSMVFLVHHVHKRLLSNFMKKFEFEISSGKHQAKKKVRFAKQASELENQSCGENVTSIGRLKAEDIWVMGRCGPKLEDMMPPNRAVLYREIMKYRNRTLDGRLRFH
ncbi:hypothetical protein VNO77_17912 [Canavalia gladiata]|uniref:Uncharacterized protein n=1 Tax=Canavalia gladiata TaxID=3824 RepID=A0AAN9LJT1_CANGL